MRLLTLAAMLACWVAVLDTVFQLAAAQTLRGR
jgi:hypothetical protein